ncbi:MAG TPA: serine hydrolase domain-containing protein [Candidatus Kapabacteria bacterium]|nr:serine hydrolase domain-containing protein [Candidatus Kapabacteria bacterium]
MINYRHRIGCVASVLCIVSAPAIAQSLPDSLARRVDSVFAPMNHADAPGCAVGIYHDDRIVYEHGYGIADLEHAVAIAPRTVFDIGSMSKQFTAACLLLLAQEGKLSLDDDVHRYLPELPDYGAPITIRNLLNHTSGLRDYIGLLALSGRNIDDVTTPEDALRMIVRQKGLDFPTGTQHQYCNTGYFLASLIVRRVSGRSLRDYAAAHIFKPLGMEHTAYVDDHTAIVPDRAVGYSRGDGGAWHRDVSYWEQNGDGGVFTTVEDLLQWDRNFYNPRVGGAGMIAELGRRGLLKNGDTLDYAEGLYYGTIGGLQTVEHSGSWGGYRSTIIRIPTEHFTVVVLSNSGQTNPDRVARGVIRAVLGGRLAPAPAPDAPKGDAAVVHIEPAAFDACAGLYELAEMPGFVLTFTRNAERFFVQATGQDAVEIVPTSDSTFSLVGVPASLTFHRDRSGHANSLTLHQGGDHEAGRAVPASIAAKELAGYAGRYYSPELDMAYTLSLVDGKLIAVNPRMGSVELTPPQTASGSRFSGSQWFLPSVEFEKGTGGRVKAMLVSLGRTNGMRFDRQK